MLPVSSLLTNWRGIDDVCLSLPCIVNEQWRRAAAADSLNANENQG